MTSRKFLNYDYRSDFMVAGESGCTLGEDANCFCAPNLDDGQSLSEWQWQCNGVVNFGPAVAEKTCPDKVPVAKGLGQLEIVRSRNLQIGTETMQQKMSVSCDPSIHPTGRPGDEVCPYSDCDEGGNHSAICACVDLEKYGIGEGTEWVCMHATCSCGADEDDNEGATGGSKTIEEQDFTEETMEESSSSSSAAAFTASALASVLAMSVIFN